MTSGTKVGFERSGSLQPQVQDMRLHLAEVIDRGVSHLLSLQAAGGYWSGELEADTTLESDYIFYLHVLGKADPSRVSRLANYVRRRQLPDGGWNIYFGGPSELNAAIKAYVALRLAGDVPAAPHMERARNRIRELGGLEASNSYVRFYLALAGAVGWDMVPAIPPELMLLPDWFPINIYEMSSWTRGIVIPLTILFARKPHWPLPQDLGVEELFRDPRRKAVAFDWDSRLFSWRNVFLALDRFIKLHERLPWKPLRRRALRRAEEWLVEHLERSDGLAAIYPAMMNAVFALVALGYAPDDPLTAREINQLARLEIEDSDTIRVQPCVSPVWDTAIALVALEEAGLPPDHPSLVSGARWLLDNQVLGTGDWRVKNPGARPGGWVFEFRNDFYPDVDDTAFVLMALQRVDYPDKLRLEQAGRRGIAWLVSMQNRDGGWGAFDKNNDRRFLTQIPFADHNAMIDPSSADVTARVFECLGRYGWPVMHPVMQRALAYLRREQTSEGAWYGRWGVNYVYGTSGVLRAMEAAGLGASDPCARGVAWLSSVQNDDGGFGESIASYYDSEQKGRGSSTPSQTAWGLIGFLAGSGGSPETGRAVAYLTEQQNADGSWDEAEFTGTGFPCVFYLKYHLYRNYFPLYALSRYRNAGGDTQDFSRFCCSSRITRRRECYSRGPMRFPLKLTANLTRYITGKRLSGEKKFPLVMMLEPLHACNLTCTGCGRIREYKSTIDEMLTVEQCLAAMEECGAPVVSICGGEPMIYPEIGRLTREILARGRHIYLCTNGMFIRKRLHEFQPTSSFFWNVHLDGMERTHDLCVERDGVFREAIEGIKAAKAAGFFVCSNTTIYKETDLNEIAELYAYLHELGVDGYMLSPAYSYAAVMNREIFMSRDEVRDKFRQALSLIEGYNLMISPIYREYLKGERELMCTAWGNPTYNPRGWKGPCYLMTDSHHATFKEFIEETPWQNYGRGRDPRCEDCMVHVGFEPSAVLGAHRKFGDNWKLLKWQLSGKMGGAGRKSTGTHPPSGGGNGHIHETTLPPPVSSGVVAPDGSLRVL